MSGTLYVVSTPIGNLEDITLRALRILKEVNLIAAEDTRHTALLLRRYNIGTETTSFHEHNERQKIPLLLRRLEKGDSIGLVSDAGTPGISDPGYRLVRAVQEAHHRVVAVPGPSAILAALVSSGFPTDSFIFLGFPPRKSDARREWVKRMAAETRTVVFFESPHRLRQTLQDLLSHLGDRPICLAKELTKIHESLVIRPISDIVPALTDPLKGEFVIVIPADTQTDHVGQLPSDEELADFIWHMTDLREGPARAKIGRAARHFGLPSRQVYAALERTKNRRKMPET